MPNKHLRNILIAFFSSSFLFAVFIFSAILFLPGQIRGVDIYGCVKANSIGILGYSLIVCAACVSGLIFLDIQSRFVKGFLFLLLILYFAILILMDSMSGWVILIIAALAGSYFKHRGMSKSVFAIPRLYLAVIIFSIFLLFIDAKMFAVHLPNAGNLKESAFIFKIYGEELGFKESLNIAVASFKDNWLLGSGQATFLYNFSKNTKGLLSGEQPSSQWIQSAEFGEEGKWLRFNRSYNYLFDIISNVGLLGLSSYLGLIIILFALILYILNSLEKGHCAEAAYFIIVPFVSLVLLQLFVINNITISFLFWIFLALIMLFLKTIFPSNSDEVCFSRENNNYGRSFFFIFEIISAVFVIGAAIFGIIACRYRLAERNYKKYLDAGINARYNIEQAAKLNPHSEIYYDALSKISFVKIEEELKKEIPDLGIVKEESVRGIEIVKQNTLKHPYSAQAWESQGDLYMAVMPVVKKGASAWAIKSFERASELEPKNTRFILELGKAYLFEGVEDGVDVVKVDKAIDYFNQVGESCDKDELFGFDNNDMLCLDGEETMIYLSKAFDAKGESQKAIGELEESDNIDGEAMFELGRLYFNNNQLEKAAGILEKIIQHNPNYSNALYTLGAVYEKMGENDKADILYRRVADLNPENEEVIGKLKN